jgi:hypothetical protein
MAKNKQEVLAKTLAVLNRLTEEGSKLHLHLILEISPVLRMTR